MDEILLSNFMVFHDLVRDDDGVQRFVEAARERPFLAPPIVRLAEGQKIEFFEGV